MTLLQAWQESPTFLILSAGLLGLLVGSFLNVVIYRLPIMMERAWRRECLEFLNQDVEEAPTEQQLNLVSPRSHCPHCGAPIRAVENIPVLSYLVLRGRCARCKARISPRYPIIEALTAITSSLVAWHFGYGTETLAALILTWSLICLSVIDIDQQLLPDAITLPLLWLGLFLSLFSVFTDSHASIIGAIAGYLSLWGIYQLFKLATGKEGMGYGDFKLLAMLGAWLGWQLLPAIILFSSLVGAVVATSAVLLLKRDHNLPIPYGPYLAGAGWLSLLWGKDATGLYLRFAGF
ncbi:MAG: A24 family peptidase [Pseudomonadota bacterium]